MADGSSLRLTWVGHSTVRIELDGVPLLTDPLKILRRLDQQFGPVERAAQGAPRPY